MPNTHSLGLENSSSQYAIIGDTSQTGLNIANNITLEAWVKPDNLSINHIVLTHGDQVFKYSYYFSFRTNGKIEFVATENGILLENESVQFFSDDSQISAGVWAHIAVTFAVSTVACKMYVNGSEISNTIGSTYNGPINSIDSTKYDFQIGLINNFQLYDGLVEEVRVWNDIRTAQEIADNYDKQLVGDEANLQGYWQFNGDYTDKTSNGNDLTAVNSPSFSSDVPFSGFIPKVIII